MFRINNRNPEVWNIAADIVVNDLIDLNTSFKLPEGAIRDKSFRKKSVEYVYEQLIKNKKKLKIFKSFCYDFFYFITYFFFTLIRVYNFNSFFIRFLSLNFC